MAMPLLSNVRTVVIAINIRLTFTFAEKTRLSILIMNSLLT